MSELKTSSIGTDYTLCLYIYFYVQVFILNHWIFEVSKQRLKKRKKKITDGYQAMHIITLPYNMSSINFSFVQYELNNIIQPA